MDRRNYELRYNVIAGKRVVPVMENSLDATVKKACLRAKLTGANVYIWWGDRLVTTCFPSGTVWYRNGGDDNVLEDQ